MFHERWKNITLFATCLVAWLTCGLWLRVLHIPEAAWIPVAILIAFYGIGGLVHGIGGNPKE